MSPPRSRAAVGRSGRLLALGALACGGAVACGASVSRVYESDVRFERCLALDWQRDVAPDLRRRCWDEWATHFAAGQPRDKVDYARRQVARVEALERGDAPEPLAQAAQPLVATPEPTSVFAPVPMMAAPATASPSTVASTPAPAPPRSDCELKCDANLEACLSGCKSPPCEQACTQRHGRCDARCEAEPAPRKREPPRDRGIKPLDG